jgi:Tfp pilus assembly protein PilF
MSYRDLFLLITIGILCLALGCGREENARQPSRISHETVATGGSAGSKSCRECHEEFYKLWSTSWHGLAMQPYTPSFAKSNLTPQGGDLTIGKNRYRVEIGGAADCIRENSPSGERKYPIVQVTGGKNVYYFLAPLERGRLQVLPLAYDVHKKVWYDMAASGIRHFSERRDEALSWTDPLYTFNTACFNCHVSELATNYDLSTDTYHTTWSEPGISCESCHGNAKEHLIAMGQLADDKPVKDIKIIRTKVFTTEQMNGMCATCHAKLVPMSTNFKPGDRFFDHFDLVTWEHPDFHPDGRDLGENYTYTSWLASRCAQSGKLDCNHCHTPSGRMRFEGADSNKSCLPCHENYVKNPVEHGHHVPGSKGNECIGCHMPMTRFAAMGRTDHSMRPPTPATTIAFKSPNACNICHADKEAAWSDQWVCEWYKPDYQKETLRRAELIDAARKQLWNRLPEILEDLKRPDGDQIYKTSLVRLLGNCPDKSKQPVLIDLLRDASPLVRSSAVAALGEELNPGIITALLPMLADDSRLVRIRGAMVLASLPPEMLQDDRDRSNLKKANAEFLAAMKARPDDWASHANLGNYYMEKRDFPSAIKCFEIAVRLDPRQIGPWVNAAMAYGNMNQNEKAEKSLRRALQIDPSNAPANYNLGLLLGEQGKLSEAEQALLAALKSDPGMAAAAYNLGILLSNRNLDEAIKWLKKARDLSPDAPKYACALAFYLDQKGNTTEAIELLKKFIQQDSPSFEAHMLLGGIYEKQREYAKAVSGYRDALNGKSLTPM